MVLRGGHANRRMARPCKAGTACSNTRTLPSFPTKERPRARTPERHRAHLGKGHHPSARRRGGSSVRPSPTPHPRQGGLRETRAHCWCSVAPTSEPPTMSARLPRRIVGATGGPKRGWVGGQSPPRADHGRMGVGSLPSPSDSPLPAMVRPTCQSCEARHSPVLSL